MKGLWLKTSILNEFLKSESMKRAWSDLNFSIEIQFAFSNRKNDEAFYMNLGTFLNFIIVTLLFTTIESNFDNVFFKLKLNSRLRLTAQGFSKDRGKDYFIFFCIFVLVFNLNTKHFWVSAFFTFFFRLFSFAISTVFSWNDNFRFYEKIR